MSEKDVQEIVSQVKEHVNALLIGVYDSAGKKNLPGIRLVLVNTQGRVTAVSGKVAALTELVRQLATAQGVTIDYAKVEAAAAAGVAKAIAEGVDLDATVSIKGEGSQ